jgi:hypothetical protein
LVFPWRSVKHRLWLSKRSATSPSNATVMSAC